MRCTFYGIVRFILLSLFAHWIVVLLYLADSMPHDEHEHGIASLSQNVSPLRDLTVSQRTRLGSVPPQNPSCLSQACLQESAQQLARIFPDRTDQQWCLEAAQSKNRPKGGAWQGILLVKGKSP
jgi:hypothetical protein